MDVLYFASKDKNEFVLCGHSRMSVYTLKREKDRV